MPLSTEKFQIAILNLQLNSEVIKVYTSRGFIDRGYTIKTPVYLRRY